MSKLLPNLFALIEALPTTARGDDARALAEAVRDSETEQDLDEAIAAVVRSWLE